MYIYRRGFCAVFDVLPDCCQKIIRGRVLHGLKFRIVGCGIVTDGTE